MEAEMVEIMRDQVQAIYRALTGKDIAEARASDTGAGRDAEQAGAAGEQAGATADLGAEDVERQFSELEALARTLPSLSGRVPPFSFTPLLDALYTDDELIFEMAVPGVDRDHLAVSMNGQVLTVSGLRRGNPARSGSTYLHGEIPRGPFYRQIRLPFVPRANPRVDLDRGIVRICFATNRAVATEGSEA